MEKTEWVTDIITFLGILLDGTHLILAIPMEKRNVAIQLLREMMEKRN